MWAVRSPRVIMGLLLTFVLSKSASALGISPAGLGYRSLLSPSLSPRFHETALFSNPAPTEGDEEETLMRLRLSLKPNVDVDDALQKVQFYAQSFPFAAILPVQPLQYLPTHDGGVDVLFLRKKTKEKGSLDGGMRFFVTQDGDGIDVLVKRNSQGQVISKMFSEKMVVQAFVKGISGEENERTGIAPTDVVAVESVFHKWL